jgi:hypothetical protein
MASNIIELDPVQGLLDYVLDIKPYHTKVIEILTEYVYDELIEIGIVEDFNLIVDLQYPSPGTALDIATITGGFNGITPFDGFTSWPVIPPNITISGPFDLTNPGYDVVSSSVCIPGDRTALYSIGKDITIDLYAQDVVLDTRTTGVQTVYTILDSQFVTFGQLNGVANTPYTLLTVASLADPVTTLPPLINDEVYVAGVNVATQQIQSIVGYSNASPVFYTDVPPGADPIPTPTPGSLSQNPDENPGLLIFSNSLVFTGDTAKAFTDGFVFRVTGGSLDGIYTTIYSKYDSISDKTYVRVLENLDTTVPFVTGDIEEIFFGYDTISFSSVSSVPIGFTGARIVENLVFSWSDPAELDVIDGFQFFINQADNPTSSFSVNGDATRAVIDGMSINVNGSPSNDNVYTVASPPSFVSPFTIITVLETVPVTEKGGWVEKYTV